MGYPAVADLLKCSNIAPMLVEAPAKSLLPMAQELASSWKPALLIEDNCPDFRQQLETALTEGVRVVLVVNDPKNVSGFIETVHYGEKGATQMVSVNRRFVEVHKAFRLCIVLMEGVSTRDDPWRERMRHHWLYRKVEDTHSFSSKAYGLMTKQEILKALKADTFWQEIDRRTNAMEGGKIRAYMNTVAVALEELRAAGQVDFEDQPPSDDGLKNLPYSIMLVAKRPWWRFWK